MSMPLLSGHLSSLTRKTAFTALQSSSSVELALLPSHRGSPMKLAGPLGGLSLPLILKDEFSPGLAVGRASSIPYYRGFHYEYCAPSEAS